MPPPDEAKATPTPDDWSRPISSKIADLDLIASWAAIVGYGSVRDDIRKAANTLRDHRDRHQAALAGGAS